MARQFDVVMEVVVRVEVNDENVITRVVENHDGEGVPQPLPAVGMSAGGTGWQDTLYRMPDGEKSVIEMLAYNAVRNGVENANRLDGWADMEREAALSWVTECEYLHHDEVA